MVVCLCVISVVSLFLALSVCVVSWLLCSSFLGMCVPGLFLLCVSLRVPCVSYVFLVVCWLFMVGCLSCVVPLGVSVSAFFAGLAVLVVGGLLVVYGCRLLFFSLCVCVVGGCVRVFCSSYFRFSFVLLCVSPGFCVWFWVCGGLFLGGCLVGLGFGVVGFWVWGGGFVLWGGCWCCCFLGVFWVGGGLWAILLLLFLLLFFCLECGFGGCWAWCCCW